jgi:hypothetical protein
MQLKANVCRSIREYQNHFQEIIVRNSRKGRLKLMNDTAIFFEFENERSALLAQDTLEELGYTTGFYTERERPTLHVQIDGSELTSALEIVQAYGGRLLERGLTDSEAAIFAKAYNEGDFIAIPAHVVNEDWNEQYATNSDAAASDKSDLRANEDDESFDPSGDDYGYFDAGIRL